MNEKGITLTKLGEGVGATLPDSMPRTAFLSTRV